MNIKIWVGIVSVLLLLFLGFWLYGLIERRQSSEQVSRENKLKKLESTKNMENTKKVYIAGGCFWGMEDLFRNRKGIIDTEVGYIGGDNEFPTYQNHPGHAEGIELTYNPDETNFREILDYFYRIHNPTTVDQQGNDKGSSYRSAIFYQNEEEKQIAEEIIAVVNQSNRWEGKVVTLLEPYTKFWPAEEYHQDYLEKNPNGYTCHYERFGSFIDEKIDKQ